jgi:hypothetical protein
VHHIVHREVRFDHSAGNLITLCHSCHGKEHGVSFETSEVLSERTKQLHRKRRLAKFAKYGREMKARKKHICVACGESIEAGDYYTRITRGDLKLSIRNEYPGGAAICQKCASGHP